MQLHKLSLQEVKEMDMVDYLNSLGYHPQRFWGKRLLVFVSFA